MRAWTKLYRPAVAECSRTRAADGRGFEDVEEVVLGRCPWPAPGPRGRSDGRSPPPWPGRSRPPVRGARPWHRSPPARCPAGSSGRGRAPPPTVPWRPGRWLRSRRGAAGPRSRRRGCRRSPGGGHGRGRRRRRRGRARRPPPPGPRPRCRRGRAARCVRPRSAGGAQPEGIGGRPSAAVRRPGSSRARAPAGIDPTTRHGAGGAGFRVGPLQVVEDEDDRLAFRRRGQEGQHGGEEEEALGVGVGRLRCRAGRGAGRTGSGPAGPARSRARRQGSASWSSETWAR